MSRFAYRQALHKTYLQYSCGNLTLDAILLFSIQRRNLQHHHYNVLSPWFIQIQSTKHIRKPRCWPRLWRPISFTNQTRSLKFRGMLGNFNTMIATDTFSVKKMEEDNAKNTSILKNKFDALLHHITHIGNIVGEFLQPKPRQIVLNWAEPLLYS